MITVDNGTEFYSKALDSWAYRRGVRLDFIRPGKPVENAYIESFNGRLREECLNMQVFLSMADARGKLDAWRKDYDECRPHSSIGNLTPIEFAGIARSARRTKKVALLLRKRRARQSLAEIVDERLEFAG
jgi:putative transposase